MPGSLLGNSVRRVEDPRFLTGQATYVGNLRFEGLAYAAFVRSPYPHARINSVDADQARQAPGVVAVYTAPDLGLEPFHLYFALNPACGRPPLARDKVRFVGDAVALVVAESEAAAMDGAELVVVDYEPLGCVTDPEAALAEGAPLQFEELGTNMVAGEGSPPGPELFAGAATVVRAQIENQRVAVVPMEGDAIVAAPQADDGFDLTVYVSTQVPHRIADQVAESFDLDRDRVRVVAPDVGGGFGAKFGLGAEHRAVIAAALRLGRPVRWAQTRSENMVAMPHARGQVQWVEIGFDAEGRVTGMHARVLADAGAYAGFGAALAFGPTRMMAQGVYAIPAIRFDAIAVVTNTTPMGALRGAGRPEAAEMLERMMDIAAAELGIDPVELRRRNFVPPFSEPFETVMGTVYDSGDYARPLDEALRRAGYEDLRAEQAARRQRGDRWQLGIGVGVYVEVTAFGGSEFGAVEVHRDGSATIRVGTSGHGQGHATTFSMLVSAALRIPIEKIHFLQADTAAVPRGGGTGGSRSLQLGGSAVMQAAEQVLEQARALTAAEFEASPHDIVVHEGGLGVAGVPARTLSWGELAAMAEERGNTMSSGSDGGHRGRLAAELDYKQAGGTFPFGAHVSVVEVDMETGWVRPVRHIAVDDCGRVINPLIVAGQQHGGIAQGMAQALWEGVVYDPSGNPLTASLAEYAMPSAAEVPFYEVANTETPTTRNPLGAKGIGEAGTIGATPAVHNAVVDALSHLGVRHLPMPCTPERVWRAIRAAAEGGPGAAAGGRPLWREPPPAFEGLPLPDEGEEEPPEAGDVVV